MVPVRASALMATLPRFVPPDGDPLPGADRWVLTLYVASHSPNSIRALVNLRRALDTYLSGLYELEVVDVFQDPGAAEREQVVAVPLLVKRGPRPARRVVGDLSNTEQLLASLGVEPRP